MRQRFVSLLLAVIFSLLPLTHAPVRAATTTGITGDCHWTLDGTVLTISGKGEMADYSTELPAPWGMNITTVSIGNGVTAVGNYAFANNYNLVAVHIPASVNGIGDYAFFNCVDLATITMDIGVEHIGNYAFSGCSDLRMIDLPDSVTVIGERAFAVSGLRSIRLSSNLATIGNYAFYYCSSLTAVDIPNSVTTVGAAAFYRCAKLEAVTIGYSVSTIGSLAFCGCEKLSSITIPDWVTTMGSGVFSSCSDSLVIRCSTEYIAQYAADSGIDYVLTIPKTLTYNGAQACKDTDGDCAIRFGFNMNCIGVSRDENYSTVIGENAVVNIDGVTYKLVEFGANVATRHSAATNLAGVDVPASKLYSINGDGTVTYTARVTGLTADGNDHRGTVIFVNGYVKYQDGEEIKTLTTGVVTGCYNNVMAAAKA